VLRDRSGAERSWGKKGVEGEKRCWVREAEVKKWCWGGEAGLSERSWGKEVVRNGVERSGVRETGSSYLPEFEQECCLPGASSVCCALPTLGTVVPVVPHVGQAANCTT
jgi:hypothetical protein